MTYPTPRTCKKLLLIATDVAVVALWIGRWSENFVAVLSVGLRAPASYLSRHMFRLSTSRRHLLYASRTATDNRARTVDVDVVDEWTDSLAAPRRRVSMFPDSDRICAY